MQLTVVGVGYVGLVTATCFAESGNDVTCIDIDAGKIDGLRRGVLPIYEPGLEELVERNLREGRLQFTTDMGHALAQGKLVFIAVGTPQDYNGAANLNALWGVAQSIRELAGESKIVIVKSTVPVGTNRELAMRLNDGAHIQHHAVSNPEFLKEGHAIEDFMKPDRVVVGVHDAALGQVLHDLYAPFLRSDHPFLVMTPESAEMTKYVANAMLATKISFINEMANLCEAVGADIGDVRRGIGHDSRIGFQFLFPGAGYGGSCFPKDVRAMVHTAEGVGYTLRILPAVDEINENQKKVLFFKVTELLGTDLYGKTIALWGLAFKPGTDDIREAPSLILIRSLLGAGAHVRVHDPAAIPNVKAVFGDRITYCDRVYHTLQGCDALVIATEWAEFRNPDFDTMRQVLRQPFIVDGRNLYNPSEMSRLGFVYSSIGRQTVMPAAVHSQERRAA
ncbi:MAG: UDP-glucose/GDP-mannose dehydrogenase family protein [Gemmataceae bacterium]|nr:UDP-glucose/GDP-mannose dehydrogenase family protein [Gemmataceae bacterium]